MRIIDVGEQGGLPYVVRELIDGINLRALGVLGVVLSVPVALTLAHQIASVLAYVHRRRSTRASPSSSHTARSRLRR